jgi:hypothetical protein
MTMVLLACAPSKPRAWTLWTAARKRKKKGEERGMIPWWEVGRKWTGVMDQIAGPRVFSEI